MILGTTRVVNVYAFPAPADLRKGYDGLYGLVTSGLQPDPLSGELFLFVNQSRSLPMWAERNLSSEVSSPSMRTVMTSSLSRLRRRRLRCASQVVGMVATRVATRSPLCGRKKRRASSASRAKVRHAVAGE